MQTEIISLFENYNIIFQLVITMLILDIKNKTFGYKINFLISFSFL